VTKNKGNEESKRKRKMDMGEKIKL